MSPKIKYWTIAHTVGCILLIVAGLFVAMASAMSASMSNTFFGKLIVHGGIWFPVVPVLSIVGTWIAYAKNTPKVHLGFVLLPWVYALAFAIVLIVGSMANGS